VHEAAAANEPVQVFVWGNTALVLAILSPAIVLVPAFRTVNVVAALAVPSPIEPNACEVGAMVIGATPVPVRLAVCVPALSVAVSVPVRAPVAVGLKVMVMTQVRAAATELPQVLVCVKSPLVAMLLTVSAAAPVFLSVTVPVALELPTATEPNARDVGVRVAVWA
jgi:hypothetical protein